MTSGGTESILMSMLVNRERALARGVPRPPSVAPASAHPADNKAAHSFGMDVGRTPLDADYRAAVGALRDAAGPDTAAAVASALTYPDGEVAPVADIAAIAAERGIACHVDACGGGFVLPFMVELQHIGRR